MSQLNTVMAIFAVVAASGHYRDGRSVLDNSSISGCLAYPFCKQKGMYKLHEDGTR